MRYVITILTSLFVCKEVIMAMISSNIQKFLSYNQRCQIFQDTSFMIRTVCFLVNFRKEQAEALKIQFFMMEGISSFANKSM